VVLVGVSGCACVIGVEEEEGMSSAGITAMGRLVGVTALPLITGAP